MLTIPKFPHNSLPVSCGDIGCLKNPRSSICLEIRSEVLYMLLDQCQSVRSEVLFLLSDVCQTVHSVGSFHLPFRLPFLISFALSSALSSALSLSFPFLSPPQTLAEIFLVTRAVTLTLGHSCPLQTILLSDLVGCDSPLQAVMAFWCTVIVSKGLSHPTQKV
jgi:hypothetical protein